MTGVAQEILREVAIGGDGGWVGLVPNEGGVVDVLPPVDVPELDILPGGGEEDTIVVLGVHQEVRHRLRDEGPAQVREELRKGKVVVRQAPRPARRGP